MLFAFLALFGTASFAKTTVVERAVISENSFRTVYQKNVLPLNSTVLIKRNLTKITKANKTVDEIIGYYWILFNDGCWRLGRVTRDENGDYWWESLGYWNYIGTTVKCMSDEEFDALC